MVSRVSVNMIAICMVSSGMAVGVVPDSKASALVSRWYRTCILNATRKVFLYFFEPVEILAPVPAPWLSSSVGLLNLKNSSLTVAVRVYLSADVTLCSRYIFSKTSPRDFTANASRESELSAMASRSRSSDLFW